MDVSFSFTGRVWLWTGPASWHFITLPEDRAAEIAFFCAQARSGHKRGFGAVRVSVQTGKTSWKTSLFPDKASGSYLLPVKASARKAEHLTAGDQAELRVSVISDLP